jgi:hypothetical protein
VSYPNKDDIGAFDTLRDHIDAYGVPGDQVAISAEMHEAILKHVGLPREAWEQFEVVVQLRPKRVR